MYFAFSKCKVLLQDQQTPVLVPSPLWWAVRDKLIAISVSGVWLQLVKVLWRSHQALRRAEQLSRTCYSRGSIMPSGKRWDDRFAVDRPGLSTWMMRGDILCLITDSPKHRSSLVRISVSIGVCSRVFGASTRSLIEVIAIHPPPSLEYALSRPTQPLLFGSFSMHRSGLEKSTRLSDYSLV